MIFSQGIGAWVLHTTTFAVIVVRSEKVLEPDPANFIWNSAGLDRPIERPKISKCNLAFNARSAKRNVHGYYVRTYSELCAGRSNNETTN